MLAESSGKLDLSECRLTTIPPEVFELTELEELSLAGNDIHFLPSEIGRLTSLKRLQLSGNYLEHVPEEVGELQALEGLWLHGNLLTRLPESVAALENLVQLSVAGNCLERLPAKLGALKALKELTAAGNRLAELPESLGGLEALEILGLHGNKLLSVPSSVAGLRSLRELWAQGNPNLTTLPAELSLLPALQHFSAADCAVRHVPVALRDAPALRTLTLYGNHLKELPPDVLAAPRLSGIWLEGNPLSGSAVTALLSVAAQQPDERLSTVGFDFSQLENVDQALITAAGAKIKVSQICGQGSGYFKLEKGPESSSTSNSTSNDHSRVLVVAFGSAPGVPNWSGLLRRVRAAATEPAHNDFDALYVVDPSRGWYGGGDAVQFAEYYQRLAAVTEKYSHVVMIGDSMGATAALMFSGLATSVHSFCPQTDLSMSSIRPAQSAAWASTLQQRVVDGVETCKGRVVIHVGNWKHDLDQTTVFSAKDSAAHVQIYSVNSHRLALALDRGEKLLPILRGAILNEMGLSANHVRIANLF